MPADPLRKRLRSKIEELRTHAAARAEIACMASDHIDGCQAEIEEIADEIAALLAESEPEPKPATKSWGLSGYVRILPDEPEPCRHGKDCVECEQEREPAQEPEPAPLKLGHAFVPCDHADACLHGYVDDTELGCGQPREAH